MVLVIVSILAATALPFAERTVQRRKEDELRHVLRATRTAIDAFHADWASGVIEPDNVASTHGYPVNLDVLAQGVAASDPDAPPRRYLRALPRNPFEDGDDQGWLLLGYADEVDAQNWNGEDVYDLRAVTDKVALDGTQISDW